MTEKLSKQIIAEALDVAMQKGCFNLNQTTNIIRAIDYLNSLEPKEIEHEQEIKPSRPNSTNGE